MSLVCSFTVFTSGRPAVGGGPRTSRPYGPLTPPTAASTRGHHGWHRVAAQLDTAYPHAWPDNAKFTMAHEVLTHVADAPTPARLDAPFLAAGLAIAGVLLLGGLNQSSSPAEGSPRRTRILPMHRLPFTSVPAWKSTSIRLEISGVIIGGEPNHYTVDRVDMTAAQLAAVAGLPYNRADRQSSVIR